MIKPEIKNRNRRLFSGLTRGLNGKAPSALFVTHHEARGADRIFFYVTGIEGGSFRYSSALVFPDGRVRLIVHELEEEEARRTGLPYDKVGYADILPEGLRDGLRRLFVNGKGLTFDTAARLKASGLVLFDAGAALEAARAQKTPAEIEAIRKASDISAQTAGKIPWLVRRGMTETALADAIDRTMKGLGSDGPAFSTIVAFGDHAADVHASPTDRKLQRGDPILCDFGATHRTMCSDITRMFVAGKASPLQRSLYAAMLGIQERAIQSVRTGAAGSAVHGAAAGEVARAFRANGIPGIMNHGLGHSIGLYVHDGPRLNGERYIIPENFVTSVEPAGYAAGFGGIRIEDTVLVTSRGAEVLTHAASKRLIEV